MYNNAEVRRHSMPKVGLVKGEDRFTNVLQALENAGDEVRKKIHGRVLIKVNTVMGAGSMADTHPEALRAVLEYLKPLKPERVWVGESSVNPNPLEIFENHGFYELKKAYAVEFLDFNELEEQPITLQTIENSTFEAPLCQAFRECDCLISLSVPKAHSDAVVTLSGKNMMGFLVHGQEWHIHGVREFGRDDNLVACTHTIHKNLRILLSHVRPDVAVLDAFHSFEAGTVPQCARGDLVWPKFAIAGADFVAVDTLTTTLLGFDPQEVGYLVYATQDGYGCGDLSQIEVVGTLVEEARFPLKPPPRVEILKSWKEN
jgi:uncharacterized protein (DUF362 family)